MKILLINFVYNWGSTGYICRDLEDGMSSKGNDVVIAAGFDFGKPKSNIFTFCSRLEQSLYIRLNRIGLVSKFEGSPLATWRLIRFIKKQKPDIVHVHNINCQVCNMYNVFKWLGKNNYKTVITHHAEILYTGNCNYSYVCNGWFENECKTCNNKIWATGSTRINTHFLWKKMANVFSCFKHENVIFTAVSPWVENRSKLSSYLKPFKCYTVMNGIDTKVFYRRKEDRNMIENRIGNRKPAYVLYVSANFNPQNKEDIKGGYYVVEIAKRCPDVTFLVVSTNSVNINFLPENICLWGRAKSQTELAQLYSNAQLTLLTSKKETFSMVCAESLCCGTPVVGFKAGGPESISMEEYSAFVDNPNISLLVNKLKDFMKIQFNRDKIAQNAALLYSKERMTNEYEKLYRDLLK